MIGLFLIGTFLSMLGLGIGYYMGSQKIKEKEETDPTEWIRGYNEWKKRNEVE